MTRTAATRVRATATKPFCAGPRATRAGSVLVELAIVTIILYLFLAVILTFGRSLHASQVVQQAADLMGRELARTPLPANNTFAQALATVSVQRSIYSRDYLVLDITNWATMAGPKPPLLNWVTTNYRLPTVNRALLPVMIVERSGASWYLRYPGALITVAAPLDPNFNTYNAPSVYSGLTIAVPMVESRTVGMDAGVETIRWAEVVEEITTAGVGPFPISQQGLVAVRIHYPFQSPVATGHQVDPLTNQPVRTGVGVNSGNLTNPNIADDGAVTENNAVPYGGTAGVAANERGTYGGAYGLGRLDTPTQPVTGARPYRQVLIGQAVWRREVLN